MQPEAKNKEQFKLLQYSDDSKSLSDLELTEIVVPRKRKVRRKTKPKNGHRHRTKCNNGTTDGSSCSRNIGIWIALASNVGWLLILSYILSMIHSEYVRLDRAVAKLTATVKVLPDEWHDKAHKLAEVQQSLQNLTTDFDQLKAAVEQQAAQGHDKANLSKLVADFGANITAISGELVWLKERFEEMRVRLDNVTASTEYFKQIVISHKLNSTADASNNNSVDNKEWAALKEATKALNATMEQLNATVISVQGAKIVALEQEAGGEKKYLSELVINSTAQEMAKYKPSYEALEKRVEGLEQNIFNVTEAIKQWDGKVAEMDGKLSTEMNKLANTRAVAESTNNNSSRVIAEPTVPVPPMAATN